MQTTPLPVNIYDYKDPRDFLADHLGYRQKINPRFSLRSWSKQMKFASPSTLSLVLQKKRKLRIQHFKRMVPLLDLSEGERLYFEYLVLFSNAETSKEQELYSDALARLHPGKKFSTIELEQLKILADPLHFTLLEMTRLQDFSNDPKWMVSRLAWPATSSQVKAALSRLIEARLLQKNADGTLTRTEARFQTPPDISNTGGRRFLKESFQRGIDAVETQDISEREFSSSIVSIKKSCLPKAKSMIREFRRLFCKTHETDEAEETYQINVQFFRLTQPSQSNPTQKGEKQ